MQQDLVARERVDRPALEGLHCFVTILHADDGRSRPELFHRGVESGLVRGAADYRDALAGELRERLRPGRVSHQHARGIDEDVA